MVYKESLGVELNQLVIRNTGLCESQNQEPPNLNGLGPSGRLFWPNLFILSPSLATASFSPVLSLSPWSWEEQKACLKVKSVPP